MKVIIVVLLLIQTSVLHSNHHEHNHDIEAPHFKYSREANEGVHNNHGHSHHDNDDDDHHHHHHHHHHHEHSEGDHHTHDQHHFHEKGHHHAHVFEEDGHHERIKSNQNYKPYDPNGILSFMNDFQTRLWVYSICSTLLISFMPFLLLSLIPLQANTAENGPMLKVLLSFGSGGLLGDAFLHLIPHSQPSHDSGHQHSHSHSRSGFEHSHGPHDMAIGSYVLAGILTFLTVEKLVRILQSKNIMIHSHSHGNGVSSDDKKNKRRNEGSRARKQKKSDVSSAEESLHSCSDGEHKHLIAKTKDETGFKVAAYLNMVADFSHNFTDGLAIGASFLSGTTVGVVTMITVLVHEIPHEIGDFAILVQSGFTKKKAMFVQLLTALGALTGCVLALCSTNGELSDAGSSSWILPFTAGGFIYIATVSVIPELLENTSTWQSIKEVVALLTGIMLMFLIAIYE
ncbi:unnamed protein product [Litomosoides sigmodontis]|uniref:Uncharacterized protein n=1 Tax=Litomosoides sigmodontis TaxID=42156 RepID=A0A3P6TIM0_LITSI|nr:unnamed protein product [Litomosoides sigmodontis]